MYLGIDLGTSGIKAVLVDRDQTVRAEVSAPLTVQNPHPGWSEQDPASWIDATKDLFAQLRTQHASALKSVEGIGLSGQMHGAVLLGSAQAVLRPAILWNDARAQKEAVALSSDHDAVRRMGNLAFAGFTAPKLHWLKIHEPEVFNQTRTVLLPKDFLRFWLSGEKVSEPSDASGTGWFDPAVRDWDDILLLQSGLRRDHMPTLVEGSDVGGQVRRGLLAELGLRDDKPVLIAGGGGDNASTAVGLGLTGDTGGLLSLGTSGVILLPSTSHKAAPELAVHAFCHALPMRWIQMAVMLACSDSLSAFAAKIGQSPATLTAALGADLRGPSDLRFFPYLGGERTPHGRADLHGGFVQPVASTDLAAQTHAVLQGISFGLRDCLGALQAAGKHPQSLMVAGGGSNSDYWLKMLATLLDLPLARILGADHAAALGAARLAMAACGKSNDFQSPKTEEVFEPEKSLSVGYAEEYERFKQDFTDHYN